MTSCLRIMEFKMSHLDLSNWEVDFFEGLDLCVVS